MKYKNKEELIRSKIDRSDTVLDIGFWGQGVKQDNPDWTHNLIKKYASEVYGADTAIEDEFLKLHNKSVEYYKKENAEEAVFGVKFDKVFAGDLIEHLTNPGLFLDSCGKNLKDGGMLILTTPNAFNLFNLTEKLTKSEPTVNRDHTFYFNNKVLKVLLAKCGWEVISVDYIYKLDVTHKESYKKKFLNIIYFILSLFTDKFLETLVVVAKRK